MDGKRKVSGRTVNHSRRTRGFFLVQHTKPQQPREFAPASELRPEEYTVCSSNSISPRGVLQLCIFNRRFQRSRHKLAIR